MAKSIFKPQNQEQKKQYFQGIMDGSISLKVNPNAYFAASPKAQKKKQKKNRNTNTK